MVKYKTHFGSLISVLYRVNKIITFPTLNFKITTSVEVSIEIVKSFLFFRFTGCDLWPGFDVTHLFLDQLLPCG